jgi:hypothetical protein
MSHDIDSLIIKKAKSKIMILIINLFEALARKNCLLKFENMKIVFEIRRRNNEDKDEDEDEDYEEREWKSKHVT